jgi:hypothetical protein
MYSFCSSHKIWISGIKAVFSLSFLMHVLDEVRYKELGLEFVSLEEKISRTPKQTSHGGRKEI